MQLCRIQVAAALLGLCLAPVAACRRAEPPQSPAKGTLHVERQAASLEAPSDLEAHDFAEQMQMAVYGGQPLQATELIDWRAILERATADIEVPEGFREAFIRGAMNQVGRGAYGEELADAIAEGGSYRLLRVYEQAGEMRVLFRLLQKEAGLNYQEYILARQPDGRVQAVDVYIYLSAERLSRSMRRMYLLAAASEPSSLMSKLMGSESEFVAHAEEFRAMAAALRDAQGERAVEIYRQLPKTVQQEKTVMLMLVQAASLVDEPTYSEAMHSFRERHPRDPCLAMLSIDYHLLRGQFDEALAAVDRVDQSVGGDPYLHVLRSNILTAAGKIEAARQLAIRAAEADPQLEEAFWSLVSISLQEKDFQETARLLNVIRERFQVEFDDLTKVPEYAEFVQSEAYQQWLRSQ